MTDNRSSRSMISVMDTHESKPYDLGRCSECGAGFVAINTEAKHTDYMDGGYGVRIPVGAEYEVRRECANGHVTYDFDYRSFVPPRAPEVSVEAEGTPYAGPVVVKYARHHASYEESYEAFEEAWETHSISSEYGEEYTIHYATPDGRILWEHPNPYDGWIRRSPDAPPIPDDEDDE